MSKRKGERGGVSPPVPIGERGGVSPPVKERTPVQVVQTIPACCPHCNDKQDYDVLQRTSELAYPGKSPDGHDRTHIVWYRVRCYCGAVYSLAQHEQRDDQ